MKQKLMGWQPEHNDNRLSYALGFIGAFYQWFRELQLYMEIRLPIDYTSTALKGMITAGLCGFAGMFGKWLFGITKQYVIDPIIKYFQNKKK